MSTETMGKLSKLNGLIILFHSIWLVLILIDFALLLLLDEGKVFVIISLPFLALVSVFFTLHIHYKLKALR